MGGSYFLARWRSPFLGASGLLAIAAAAPADAQSAQTLTLRAYGTIASSCGVQSTQPFSSGDFTMAGQSSATALVNCNTGFAIKVVSQNGEVQNATPAPAPAGFVKALPYRVKLELPLNNGTLSGSCDASAMKSGTTGCPMASVGLLSGSEPAFGKTATLTASWDAPTSTTRPLAGSYSDILTISVVPKP